MSEEIFGRVKLMLGEEVFAKIRESRVAIFGLGGVGGWCAEALARSGVGKLLLVDSDRVATTNVNRQVMATSSTIGEIKVDVLASRLREINPEIEIESRAEIYNEESSASFAMENYDYVIDAIDSLSEKAHLIRAALAIPTVTLFSSMGAAVKMDLFQIRATSFKKVEGDGLARALRHKFKATGGIPERNFICVWSPEHRDNKGEIVAIDESDSWSSRKARINGTIMHTTATFGLALANLVIADIEKKAFNYSS